MAMTHDEFIENLRCDVKHSLRVYVEEKQNEVRKTPVNNLRQYIELVRDVFEFDRDAARVSVAAALGMDLDMNSQEEVDQLNAKIREIIPDFDDEIWGQLDS